MSLLTTLSSLLNLWRPAFCKTQAFERAKEHAYASICGLGRKTITTLAIENIPWKIMFAFYGGEWRSIRYKEVNNVLWQNGTKRKPMQAIVMAPIPYVRGGKRNYKDAKKKYNKSIDRFA